MDRELLCPVQPRPSSHKGEGIGWGGSPDPWHLNSEQAPMVWRGAVPRLYPRGDVQVLQRCNGHWHGSNLQPPCRADSIKASRPPTGIQDTTLTPTSRANLALPSFSRGSDAGIQYAPNQKLAAGAKASARGLRAPQGQRPQSITMLITGRKPSAPPQWHSKCSIPHIHARTAAGGMSCHRGGTDLGRRTCTRLVAAPVAAPGVAPPLYRHSRLQGKL